MPSTTLQAQYQSPWCYVVMMGLDHRGQGHTNLDSIKVVNILAIAHWGWRGGPTPIAVWEASL